MPLLGFKKQFATLVESGEKLQTLRAYRKDGRGDPKVGDTLYLWIGLRQKGKSRKLGEATCTFAKPFRIERDDLSCWTLDGKQLDIKERRDIARRDGFDNATAMQAFFAVEHGFPFEGLLIRWDEIERGT